MSEVDEYIQKVIALGDEGSALLRAICTPTLNNSDLVHILEDSAVLRGLEKYFVAVHSASGDSEKTDVAEHAASMVTNLVKQANLIDAKPVAFANVIDSNTGNKQMLSEIAKAMVIEANAYELAIMNGENAILGPRVNCDANVCGTMISIAEKGGNIKPGIFTHMGITYAVFDPGELAVTINSDGIGTKTDFYERAGRHERGIRDFLAMNLDDKIKDGGIAKVVSGACEMKGDIPFDKIREYAASVGDELNVAVILQPENVGNRIRGYNDEISSYNISGSVVGVIDEQRLRNPLKPNAGEYIIAIVGKPNPRSNGITGRRNTMIEMLGIDWHKTEKGKRFLEFLTEPSTILYPVFKELIDRGIATSVYHMSGGAYNSKLAKPLAKHNLFANIEGLFTPDPVDIEMMEFSETSTKNAYAKWPMGNDGFVTASNKDAAIEVIQGFGLKARVVGQLEEAKDKQTGVKLKAFNKEEVYFSGRD